MNYVKANDNRNLCFVDPSTSIPTPVLPLGARRVELPERPGDRVLVGDEPGSERVAEVVNIPKMPQYDIGDSEATKGPINDFGGTKEVSPNPDNNCCNCGYMRKRSGTSWSVYMSPRNCNICKKGLCDFCNVGMYKSIGCNASQRIK